MRVSIVTVSAKKEIFDELSLRRTGLIPSDSQRLPYYAQRKAVFSLSPFLSAKGNALGQFYDFVDALRNKSDAVIILCDFDSLAFAQMYKNACFTAGFALRAGEVNIKNFFGGVLAKNLRDFATFSVRFDDLKYQKIFLLPLRNFIAPEINDMQGIFDPSHDRKSFGSQIDSVVGALRKRQTPKRPKNNNTEYLKDDNDRFFIYGHERHSRPETGIPPHNRLCSSHSNFRFGRSFDDERHFNVSVQPDGARISGNFMNCHGVPVQYSSCSHVNLFPNDFNAP